MKSWLKHFNWGQTGLAVLCLSLALAAAYSNSMEGPFIFDDASSIIENTTIRDFGTALFPPGNSGLTVSGRPMLNLSLAINYNLHGTDVWGYHFFNLLIHVGATLALFGVVRRTLLLPSLCGRFGDSAWFSALVVALVWSLHPLETESVTYMIQRAEALVGLFCLLTFYFFVRALTEPERRRWFWLTIVCCYMGMASKEVMAAVPVLLFLYDRTFVAGSFAEAWRRRRELYLFLISSWLLLALCILSTGGRGSTVGFNAYASWWRYGLTQGFGIAHYLRLVFWPDRLVLDYGQTLAYNFADAGRQFSVVFALGLATLWAVWKRPMVGFLGVFFFAVLAPSSSIVPVLTQTLAEHRMYLALAGVVSLVVMSMQHWCGKRILYVWLAVAVALGVRTYVRNNDYRTDEGIWRSVTEKCPYNPRGWSAVGAICAREGRYAQAKTALRTALRYCPKNSGLLADYGNVLARLKETKEAEEVFRYTLKLEPSHYESNCGYGALLLDLGRAEEALACYEKAVLVRPDGMEAVYCRGKALLALHRTEEAVAQFFKVLGIDSGMAGARNDLGNALVSLGRAEKAISIFKAGLLIDETNPELGCSFGLAQLSLGKIDEAVAAFRTVLKFYPDYEKAHANLGLAESMRGDAAAALGCFEEALRCKGDLPADQVRALHVSAGNEGVKLERFESAREHYAKAVVLSPDSLPLRRTLAALKLQTGMVAEAITDYERIITMDTSLPEVHGELGIAYMAAGRLDEAQVELETCLRLQPDNRAARDNLERLRAMRR